MPANTANGYPYPLPSESVAAGADNIKALAEAIDVKNRSAAGRATVTIASGASSGSAAVTFPAGQFTTPPRIALVTVNSASTTFLAATNGPTTSGMNVLAFHRDGANVGAATNLSVSWLALP